MKHLEIICEAYDKVGICYVVRDAGEGSKYLFTCSASDQNAFRTERLEYLTPGNRFIEFKDGELVSY